MIAPTKQEILARLRKLRDENAPKIKRQRNRLIIDTGNRSIEITLQRRIQTQADSQQYLR